MKHNKRPLAGIMAAVLTFSMSVSGILLNLTAGAATVDNQIKATIYKADHSFCTRLSVIPHLTLAAFAKSTC